MTGQPSKKVKVVTAFVWKVNSKWAYRGNWDRRKGDVGAAVRFMPG